MLVGMAHGRVSLHLAAHKPLFNKIIRFTTKYQFLLPFGTCSVTHPDHLVLPDNPDMSHIMTHGMSMVVERQVIAR